MQPLALSADEVRIALDGLDPAAIPIACSKRLTLKQRLDGRLFRIGAIPPFRAFVLKRGGLTLIYVAESYKGYRYVARKLHGHVDATVDYDHALGRALASAAGISYVLLLRADRAVNRAHGRSERPVPRSGVTLRKTFGFDPRILGKALGRTPGAIGHAAPGYDVNVEHRSALTPDELVRFGVSVGLAHTRPGLDFLREIER